MKFICLGQWPDKLKFIWTREFQISSNSDRQIKLKRSKHRLRYHTSLGDTEDYENKKPKKKKKKKKSDRVTKGKP